MIRSHLLAALAAALALSPSSALARGKGSAAALSCAVDAKDEQSTAAVPRVCVFKNPLKKGAVVGPLVITHFSGKAPTVVPPKGTPIKVGDPTRSGPFYLPRGWGLTAKGPGLIASYVPEGIKPAPAPPPTTSAPADAAAGDADGAKAGKGEADRKPGKKAGRKPGKKPAAPKG